MKKSDLVALFKKQYSMKICESILENLNPMLLRVDMILGLHYLIELSGQQQCSGTLNEM
jgi:hypothetical protein